MQRLRNYSCFRLSRCVKTASRTYRTEAKFLAKLDELGARLAPEAVYRGTAKHVEVICRNEHRRPILPKNVLNNQGVCGECAGQSIPRAAERFAANIVAQGGRITDPDGYQNVNTPVQCVCPAGHVCHPTPNSVRKGKNMCRACAGNDPKTAGAAFEARLGAAGGSLLPGGRGYTNAHTPVDVICREGHTTAITPHALGSGQGLCEECHVNYDRVYMLQHPAAGAIKVGVASGEARVRGHLRRGYRMVSQWTDLTHAQATNIEKATLRWWSEQHWQPVADAPEDGRTETASSEHLPLTLAYLTTQLGVPRRTQRELDLGAA